MAVRSLALKVSAVASHSSFTTSLCRQRVFGSRRTVLGGASVKRDKGFGTRPLCSSAGQDVLLVDKSDGVLTLTLNRPKQRNALSMGLLARLREELKQMETDGCTSIRCAIIRGNGPMFCAGHDLKEMTVGPLSTDEARRELFSLCSDVMELVESIPQPVISAVHGLATAAGCQLAASSDMVVCSATAQFQTPGVSIGLFCSTPAVPLVRNIGRKAAMDMLLTGRLVSADEAQRMGLVSRICEGSGEVGVNPDPSSEVSQEQRIVWASVNELAQSIAARSGSALALGKETFRKQIEMELHDAYALAGNAMADNMCKQDAAEGISAFLEKRKPEWKHR